MKKNVTEIANEMKTLLASNYAITKRGGFFTAEQCANEQVIAQLFVELRRIVGYPKAEQIHRNCYPNA